MDPFERGAGTAIGGWGPICNPGGREDRVPAHFRMHSGRCRRIPHFGPQRRGLGFGHGEIDGDGQTGGAGKKKHKFGNIFWGILQRFPVVENVLDEAAILSWKPPALDGGALVTK